MKRWQGRWWTYALVSVLALTASCRTMEKRNKRSAAIGSPQDDPLPQPFGLAKEPNPQVTLVQNPKDIAKPLTRARIPDETFGLEGKQVTMEALAPFASRAASITLAPQADAPWRNAYNTFDVNDSGTIEPLDALLIINKLNRDGIGPLPAPTGDKKPPPYYDITGDNSVSPLDALLVINYLNRTTGKAPFELTIPSAFIESFQAKPKVTWTDPGIKVSNYVISFRPQRCFLQGHAYR